MSCNYMYGPIVEKIGKEDYVKNDIFYHVKDGEVKYAELLKSEYDYNLYLQNLPLLRLSLNRLTVVSGDLVLFDTNLTSLPDNLQIGGDLVLNNTKITSLPKNLQVEGYLHIRCTPISEKYTVEEIRQMCTYLGGIVCI